MAEQSTGERAPSKTRDEIIREAQRLEESTLYSCKGHHYAARGWKNWHYWLGIPTIAISALVGAAAFSKFSDTYPWLAGIGAALSMVVVVLSGLTTFLNPNEKEKAHLNAAHGYDKLNNDARIFSSIECWREESTDVLAAQLRELVDRKSKLNETSPQIPDSSYQEARKGIAGGEADFKIDKAAESSQPEANS